MYLEPITPPHDVQPCRLELIPRAITAINIARPTTVINITTFDENTTKQSIV